MSSLPLTPESEPQFTAPWQARAFALTVHLHDRGLFDWPEWVACFSGHIAGATDVPDGSDGAAHIDAYFQTWLTALSDLLDQKGLAEADAVRQMADVWRRAAHATPHGTPIRYEAGL
ncbi:nitrile hydratase accessory protein [Pseudooceanicola sp. MF1-13]|uniref:nitrile hydratase accessory protein n=1 Tax=Pseudooceanicola sp. MF1-13 TaxID=3379095 RepID=UPI0038920BAA